jgi:hypothetical protein
MPKLLKPWYAISAPHSDIQAGRLDESIFAANVWAVAQRTAPEVYLDPEEFLRKSYMTVGLKTILTRVATALRGAGESGDRVISLQTTFGGGKTHTLVALWHLAKNGAKLAKSSVGKSLKAGVGGAIPEGIRGVAVFTNASCDPTQGRDTPSGVHTRTLWGELAEQLGGKELYEKVRANDETQRVPQGIFVDVLRKAAPCLILLDELADYCVGAAAVPVGETTLADQTISFIQQLTEAVQQVPGAVVVATLPASKYEVAQSEKGQEAFITLEKRFQRLGADIKPVADDEIYEVVRARLFDSITPGDATEYPQEVAGEYVSMYATHSGEVPAEVTKNTYKELIVRSYPFHPLLIDTLYKRWGSHPDFQRTRGVLRLLGSLVGDLWDRRDGNTQSQPLIQPCHIRWSVDALQAALTRFWGPAYQSVAAADVLGDASNAGAVDLERAGDYRRERIAQGLASAMLLGSFGGQAQRSGFSAKDLKVACSRPGLNWNYIDGALLELEDHCFYLHSTAAGNLGKRYWFGTKPNLNSLIVQYRQQTGSQSFDAEILDAIRQQTSKDALAGATWRPVVDPTADLPEQKSLTLLLLSPSLTWNNGEANSDALKKKVLEISNRCGGKDRIYRNTLVFLAATARGASKLRQVYRERAALQGVRRDYADQLDPEQLQDLNNRVQSADRAVTEAFGPAYTVVLRVRGSDVETTMFADARQSLQEHLGYVWTTLVEDEEWILRRVGSVTLKDSGLVLTEGGIRVKDAVDAFLRFTDKPLIASKESVTVSLAQSCKDGVIGIGRGPSASNLQSRYCKKDVTIDPSEEGLWVIPPFEPRTEMEAKPANAGPIKPGSSDISSQVSGAGAVGAVEQPSANIHRITIQGAVPVENWSDLFRSFIAPGTRLNLKRQRLSVDFELEWPDENAISAADAIVKAMKEAARQLGLSFEVFGQKDSPKSTGGSSNQ